MGYRKAVVASRLAGTPEQVIDGETGYLVAPKDSDELAVAMARFCSDPGLAKRMGQKGFERFQKRFTAPMAVDNYVVLYNSLIEDKKT
jgi:glycosyltransferase involved in cell wall biosynthesis